MSRRRISLFVELNALLYLGYAEYRFAFLRAAWDYYLLASALVYFAAAYRFDNRIVLALGIATLGGWFGVRLTRVDWFDDASMRVVALLYGVVVAAIAMATWQMRIKRHFLDAYLQVAAIVVLSALTSSVLDGDGRSPWLLVSVAAAALCMAGGIRLRRFSFMVYGAFAGYVSVSSELLRHSPGIEPFGDSVSRWYRWTSWAITWALPLMAGRAAVAERDPLLLRVAMAAGLASLLTNKAYLGWPRQPWDPMLLGVVLVAAALWLRRWLANGAEAERHGFTARQLVPTDDAAIQLASLAAVTVQPAPTRSVPEPPDPMFSGGRSGGTGAGSEF